MKFSTREDLQIPIEQAFDLLSDFNSHERMAMRRGVDVQRLDMLAAPGVGMQWRAQFKFRGRQREMHLETTSFEKPEAIRVISRTKGVDGAGHIELVPLSRKQTRMHVEFEIKPTTLSARLMVQSLRLAKQSLVKRFKKRVAEYAKTLEERYEG